MHLQTQLVPDSQLATRLCLKSVPAWPLSRKSWVDRKFSHKRHSRAACCKTLAIPAQCRSGAERFIADGLQLTCDITITQFAVPLNQPVGACSVRNFLVPPGSQRVNQHEVIF